MRDFGRWGFKNSATPGLQMLIIATVLATYREHFFWTAGQGRIKNEEDAQNHRDMAAIAVICKVLGGFWNNILDGETPTRHPPRLSSAQDAMSQATGAPQRGPGLTGEPGFRNYG